MKKIVFLFVLFLGACTGSTGPTEDSVDETPVNEPTAPEENQPEEIEYDMELPYSSYFNKNNPLVTMVVAGKGTIVIELFTDVAPNTVNNMIKLIQDGFYEGLIFHRVIPTFMIQGGWGDLKGKQATCTIAGDFALNGTPNSLAHDRGVISMARTDVFDSASSQFFIMRRKNIGLDGGYAAFGGMVSGFDVLDAIATVSTHTANVSISSFPIPITLHDTPVDEVVIESVTVDLRGYNPAPPVCVN